MQRHLKNDLLYLLRILESIEKIRIYTQQFDTAEAFFIANDQKEFNACLNLLAQIGEQTNKLSKTLLTKYEQVDWPKIRGFRNRIIHDYTGIDLYITFDTIRNDILALKPDINEIIIAELATANFDIEEFTVAKESPYLRHVDFALLMKIY